MTRLKNSKEFEAEMYMYIKKFHKIVYMIAPNLFLIRYL